MRRYYKSPLYRDASAFHLIPLLIKKPHAGSHDAGSYWEPLWVDTSSRASLKEKASLKLLRVVIDKNFLFRGGSIGWLFWLVNGYFASILHRKAGAGDAIWQGRWIGGRPFEKSARLLVESADKGAFSAFAVTSFEPISDTPLRHAFFQNAL